MARKIIVNIFVSFGLLPMALLVPYFGNIITGNYKYYDTHFETLTGYLSVLFHEIAYPLISILTLLIVFLPFQLIKDYYAARSKKFNFVKKVLVLSGIVAIILILAGSFFVNLWWIPWWYNFMYLAFAFGFGLLFTSLLYIMLDRYVEKQQSSLN